MAGELGPHRSAPAIGDHFVAGTRTQRRAQIRLVPGEETVADLAVGRQPHPVAVAAERSRDRADDANRVRTVVDEELLSRSRAAPVHRREPERLSQQAERLAGGDHGLAVPVVLGVERHLLDEAELVVVIHAPTQQLRRILVVDAAHQDGVDLDRFESGFAGGGQSLDDIGEAVAASDLGERFAVDRVEADVDPIESGFGQRLRGVLEAQAVGRHGRAGTRGQGLGLGDDLGEAPPQQRLTAGEADVADTEHLDTDADQADELFIGQSLIRRQPVEAFGRHAVFAAQIAAVGQRHAQVSGNPPVLVDQSVP